jgi:hypothetical protein
VEVVVEVNPPTSQCNSLVEVEAWEWVGGQGKGTHQQVICDSLVEVEAQEWVGSQGKETHQRVICELLVEVEVGWWAKKTPPTSQSD